LFIHNPEKRAIDRASRGRVYFTPTSRWGPYRETADEYYIKRPLALREGNPSAIKH